MQLNQSLKACLAEKNIDASCIERLNDTLQHILQRVIPISMQTMPYTTGGEARPRYRERTTHRRLQTLAKTRKALYQIVKLHRDSQPKKVASRKSNQDDLLKTSNDMSYDHILPQVQELLHTIPKQYRQQLQHLNPPSKTDSQGWQNWQANLILQRKKTQKQKDKIVQGLRRKTATAKRRHAQRTYVNNPKQWHKKIFKTSESVPRLVSMRDKASGKIVNKPEEVAKLVHTVFQRQARPAFGEKTSKYLPEDVKRDYPWMMNTAHDPFFLESKVGSPQHGTFSLLDHVRDPTLYQKHVQELPNRKSPGPDGIPNELLKHLPESAHHAIHKLFILMWMTGHTPTAWKESHTILYTRKATNRR